MATTSNNIIAGKKNKTTTRANAHIMMVPVDLFTGAGGADCLGDLAINFVLKI